MSKGCGIDSQDLHGRMALHWATFLNSDVSAGELRDMYGGAMSYSTAIGRKRLPSSPTVFESIFRLLIERGTNIELSDIDGNTPLLLAARAPTLVL